QQTHHHFHLLAIENNASPLVLYLNQHEDISFYDKFFLLQFIAFTAVRSFKNFIYVERNFSTFITVITVNIYVYINEDCSAAATTTVVTFNSFIKFTFQFLYVYYYRMDGGGTLFFSYYSKLIKLPSTGKTNKVHACIVYMNSTLNAFSVSQRFRLLKINNLIN
uniref:Uncharacterized protein n=1 Tax=Glossina palpalis gambiensis TaxID=67801 RepID=A0A1B0AXA2_9MUSC